MKCPECSEEAINQEFDFFFGDIVYFCESCGYVWWRDEDDRTSVN